jgi:hypothetical protein
MIANPNAKTCEYNKGKIGDGVPELSDIIADFIIWFAPINGGYLNTIKLST